MEIQDCGMALKKFTKQLCLPCVRVEVGNPEQELRFQSAFVKIWKQAARPSLIYVAATTATKPGPPPKIFYLSKVTFPLA